MKTSLGNVELFFYFAGWITSNIFSLYHLFTVQEELFQHNETCKTHFSELKPGWSVLNRYRDVSDIEWLTWKRYFEISWLPALMHFLGSETLRNYKRILVPYWYILFSLCFIFVKFGTAIVLLMILQPMVYVVSVSVGGNNSSVLVWTVSVILLATVNTLKSSVLVWSLAERAHVADEDVYLLFISLGWIQVRCMSYSFDQIERHKHVSKYEVHSTDKEIKTRRDTPSEAAKILSYSLYFPTLLMGPIVLYSDFERSFKEIETSLWTRIPNFLLDISLMLVYMFLMDAAFHFIYFLGLQNECARLIPSMALCGAGLWMGVQFHLKYVVIYGTCGATARLDHVRAPPTPRCIARVHLYSHMWKHFDVGLYRFLIKYIYKPTISAISGEDRQFSIINKLKASFVTFVFIFLWHGTMLSIFIWSILNYVGLTIEILGTLASKTESYSKFKKKILKTDRIEEMFKALISTPLLIMSALSNFYLFAGYDIGNIFVERFFSETWYNIIFIYFCLYTCCIVSAVLSDVPSRTARSNTCYK